MATLIRNLPEFGMFAAWVILWGLGGIWLVRAAFRLQDSEQVPAGLAVGLVVQTLLANMMAPRLDLPVTSPVAAGMVFAAGLAAALWKDGPRSLYRIPVRPVQLGAMLVLFWVFLSINRGLSIFDDYAHMPTVSIMATGDIPPHFPLDPSIPYQYHYFLMLFAAQVTRMTTMYPWNALDLARALSFALSVPLVYAWVRRLTLSSLGGLLGGIWYLFSSGTRWLLLLLPPAILQAVSDQVQLLGSASQTGKTLADALVKGWNIAGGGPLAYPFAFYNGNNAPAVMAFGPNGVIGASISMVILLSFNRWRGWMGGVVTALLMASSDLLSETGPLLGLAIWVLIALIVAIRRRSLRLPRSLWAWLAVVVAARVLGLFQGGALSGILAGLVDETAVSYQTVGFRLVFPPEFVSAHLGVLRLTNPWQLLAALCEIGPAILVLPLAAFYGWKAFRAERWYEAVVIAAPLLTLPLVFVEFTGSTGVRNTARLYRFIGLADAWAVPLAWIWLRRRSQILKSIAAALFLMTILGGIVLFGVELPAAQKPVTTYFTTDLDVKMAKDYWNQLEPGALVFDPQAFRAPTIFGRATKSSTTWYADTPAWQALVKDPNPTALRAAGFRYVYYDEKYWGQLTAEQQQKLQESCVKPMREYSDWQHNFRRLADIGGCR